jgi:thioredoxin-related protein
MKLRIILCILFFSKNILVAQNTEGGMQFINEDYKVAVEKAKQENKLIFMDAYTTWCAPCKLMQKNTFPDAEVAKFYNTKFINLTMDMEKGQGPELLQQFGIVAFPTLLFIDKDGKVAHKALGYHDPKMFLELGQTALSGDNSLSSWTEKYEKGDRSPTFLKDYAFTLQKAFDNRKTQIAEEYLNTQTDWKAPENLDFIYRFTEGVDSKLFGFLVKNKEAFKALASPQEIEAKIQEILTTRIYDNKNLPGLKYVDSLLALTYQIEKLDRVKKTYRMSYYRMKGDRPNYAQAAVDYFKKYNDQASEMSDVALIFAEQIDDKKMLNKAVKWAKKAVKLEKSYLNQLTVASVYQKLDKKSKAKKAAEAAIELAIKNNENYEEATEILKLMNISLLKKDR